MSDYDAGFSFLGDTPGRTPNNSFAPAQPSRGQRQSHTSAARATPHAQAHRITTISRMIVPTVPSTQVVNCPADTLSKFIRTPRADAATTTKTQWGFLGCGFCSLFATLLRGRTYHTSISSE